MEGEERSGDEESEMALGVGVWKVMMRVGDGEGDTMGEEEGEVDGDGEG